jgi:basic membrane lipoprotein Med (substrate-binding protein (PBP1-ABC) superfamily)
MSQGLTRRRLLQGSAAFGTAAVVGASARPALAEEPLKVGVVYTSPIADIGWTKQHVLAVAAVERELAGKVTVTQVDNVFQPQDAERVFRELARSGNRLLFGTSFSHGTPMQKVAPQFSEAAFEQCSGIKRLGNLGTFEARYYEGTYVAGVAASKLTQSGKLGFVAGFPIPDVIGAANTFLLGARTANPAATCSVVFLNSWFDPGLEKDAANVLLAQGCDAIASMTDTAAAVQEAENKGAWSIGYASDLSSYAPKKLITSMVLDWSSIYLQAAQDVLAGGWTAEDRWLGLAAGVVKMAPYNVSVPAEAAALADQAAAAIKTGSLQPWAGEIRDQSGQVRVPKGDVLDHDGIRGIRWFVEGMIGKLA